MPSLLCRQGVHLISGGYIYTPQQSLAGPVRGFNPAAGNALSCPRKQGDCEGYTFSGFCNPAESKRTPQL